MLIQQIATLFLDIIETSTYCKNGQRLLGKWTSQFKIAFFADSQTLEFQFTINLIEIESRKFSSSDRQNIGWIKNNFVF